MFKIIIRLTLILLVINLCVSSCEAFRNRGYGSKNVRTNKEGARAKSSLTSGGLPTQPARRGLGLSAWGIVTIVVSCILAIAGMYYFSICYPILCKKSRKYDPLAFIT